MLGREATTGLPGALAAPRRNNYYYAKMMDVLHFQMEQSYGQQMRWLGNRLTVGSGVLCGLDVTVEDGLLCVAPGAAIDPLGREIIVPVKTCLDPHALGDPCGGSRPERPEHERRVLTLSVCHRECFTDYAPVLVSDCPPREPCAPGTVVETFRFVLEEGAPDRPGPGLCEKCGATLFPRDRGTSVVVGVEGSVMATVEVGGAPRAIATSPDGRVAVVLSDQQRPTVQVLDVETLAVAELSRREIAAPVGGVSFAPDGGPALVTSGGGVAVIDVSGARPRLIRALLNKKAYGRCAAARGGRMLFAIDGRTGNVDVIDVAARRVRETIDAGGQARDVAVSADGLRLYVTRSSDHRVTERLVANPGTARELGGFTRGEGQHGALAVRTTPGGVEPLVARGAQVRIVRADGAEERALAEVQARDAAVSSDGALLYLLSSLADPSGRRNELVLFEAGQLQELARVEIGQDPHAVAVVPGRLRAFVTNAGSGSVSVIDGRVVREEPGTLDRRRRLCECTSGPCPASVDARVPLAVLALQPDGTPGRVETCAVRKRLYSNETLLDLILCLAERLDECCGPAAPDPRPPEPGRHPRSPAREGDPA